MTEDENDRRQVLNRRNILLAGTTLAAASAIAASAPINVTKAQAQSGAVGRKPNILFIMGDDIGWYNVSAYNMGVMGYRTPNIDRYMARKARSSPTGTASRVAPPAAPPSSPASRRSALASPKSACPVRSLASGRSIRQWRMS